MDPNYSWKGPQENQICPSVLGVPACSKTIPDSSAVCLSHLQILEEFKVHVCPGVYCSYSWKSLCCSTRLCHVYFIAMLTDFFYYFLQDLQKNSLSPALQSSSVFYPSENLCVLDRLFSFLVWINKFSAFSNDFLKCHPFLKHFLVADCSQFTYTFLKIWWSDSMQKSILTAPS